MPHKRPKRKKYEHNCCRFVIYGPVTQWDPATGCRVVWTNDTKKETEERKNPTHRWVDERESAPSRLRQNTHAAGAGLGRQRRGAGWKSGSSSRRADSCGNKQYVAGGDISYGDRVSRFCVPPEKRGGSRSAWLQDSMGESLQANHEIGKSGGEFD